MKKIALLCLALGLAGSGFAGLGCGGSSVPYIAGTYDLVPQPPPPPGSIPDPTPNCGLEFSTRIDVIQTGASITLRPKEVGFSEVTGSIDEQGILSFQGTLSNFSTYACSGSTSNQVMILQCQTSNDSCTITYEKLVQ